MQTYLAYNAYQHFEMNREVFGFVKRIGGFFLFVFVKTQLIRQVVPVVFIYRTAVFSSSKNWVVTFMILRH